MRHSLILLTTAIALFSFTSSVIAAQDTREEYGKCGYYADALHGRQTSSGEIYDKNLFTCAHKTLPFGTQIRVTRLDNKKSVVVRVNDRGPYLDGYVTDISRAAAEQIGLIRDGVTRVKIEVAVGQTTTAYRTLPANLEPVTYSTQVTQVTKSNSKTQLLIPQRVTTPVTYSTYAQPSPASVVGAATTVSELVQIDLRPVERMGFGLQVASLSSSEKLFQEMAKLQSIWPGKVVINHEEVVGFNSTSFKLIVGPYATRKEAEAQQKKAGTKGYKKSFVVNLGE